MNDGVANLKAMVTLAAITLWLSLCKRALNLQVPGLSCLGTS